MIKYDYTYFHKTLLKLQSLDFNHYQYITEKDLLLRSLCSEEIGDYSEVDWRWISDLLYGEEGYDGQLYYFDINGELEQFINKIIPRDERIRILTYLRDNCMDCLFNGFYDPESISNFEKECARLISYNIKQSRRDEVHGKFLLDPKPNLQAIAMGEPEKPKHSILESTTLAAVPSFPNDRNILSKDLLLQVAYDFMDMFHKSVEEYEESGRDERKKPCMSQKEYVDTIYRMLGTRANRYLYWDKNPVYQVYFIVACLWGMPDHRRAWHEKTFAEGIGDYLETTMLFKGCKAKIKEVIQRVLSLNEYVLDFGADDVEKAEEREPQISDIDFSASGKLLAETVRKVLFEKTEQPKEHTIAENIDKSSSELDDSFFDISEKMTHEMCQKELLRCIRTAKTKAAACREILKSANVYFVLSDKTNQEIADIINPWVKLTDKKYVFTKDDFRKARRCKK